MSLVLSRKESETIVIYPYPEGDDRYISITLDKIGESQVRLRFEAPDDVDILREELLD